MITGNLTVAIFDEAAGWSLPDGLVSLLADRAGPAWKVRKVTSRTELLTAMGDTVGIVGLPLTEEQIAPHVGRLRWIQLSRSAGDATPALVHAMGAGVRASSAATPRAARVVEHTLAATLMMLRRLDLAAIKQSEHDWSVQELTPQIRSLRGSRVAVISPPPFARAIAGPLAAFGAEYEACVVGAAGAERALDEESIRARPLSELNDVLAHADVVICATPRIVQTMGLMGRKQFSAMKRSGVFIDVSRGGVTDEAALIDALRRGLLGCAALDVFASEPLPPTSPFWTMANVVVTPHIAAAGEGFWDRLIEHAGENARRAAEGEPLLDELPPALYVRK